MIKVVFLWSRRGFHGNNIDSMVTVVCIHPACSCTQAAAGVSDTEITTWHESWKSLRAAGILVATCYILK